MIIKKRNEPAGLISLRGKETTTRPWPYTGAILKDDIGYQPTNHTAMWPGAAESISEGRNEVSHLALDVAGHELISFM